MVRPQGGGAGIVGDGGAVEGDSPRICIGQHFAMLEAVLILAAIAQRYQLALVPGHTLRLAPSITVRPKGGLPMIVHRRTKPGR